MNGRTLAVVVLAVAGPALATPELVWESEDLDNGWTSYTVSVSDDLLGGWAVNIDFWGEDSAIGQQQAFGALDVNLESNANAYDAIDPTYDKGLDSWVFDGWNVLPTGISGPPGEAFHIHAGTPGGVPRGTTPLARFVVQSGGIGWDGILARKGVDYRVSSNPLPPIPDPPPPEDPIEPPVPPDPPAPPPVVPDPVDPPPVVPDPVDPPPPPADDDPPPQTPDQPSLIWRTLPVDDEWTAYRAYLVDPSGAEASWAADVLFTTEDGTLHQEMAFGVLPVETEEEAEVYDRVDTGYDMTRDTWVFSPFVGLVDGIVEGEDFLLVHAGTPGGEPYGDIALMQLVTNGRPCWEGTLARQGVDYPVTSEGTIFDPLPEDPPPPPTYGDDDPPPPGPAPDDPDGDPNPPAPGPVHAGGPELIWDVVDLGDGRYGYTVYVSDSENAPWAVNIDFWGVDGTAEQILAFGALDVNTEAEAMTYDPLEPAFSKAMDSWVFGDWTALPTGIRGEPGEAFHIHAGTPGGMAYGTIPLAYIVARGDIEWEGIISRLGVDYYTRSFIPEPTAGVLLAIGLVALRRRRRSRELGLPGSEGRRKEEQ